MGKKIREYILSWIYRHEQWDSYELRASIYETDKLFFQLDRSRQENRTSDKRDCRFLIYRNNAQPKPLGDWTEISDFIRSLVGRGERDNYDRR